MVLGTELQESSSDVSQSFSPDLIARANFKNSELDKSLGISPTSDFLDDPNSDVNFESISWRCGRPLRC